MVGVPEEGGCVCCVAARSISRIGLLKKTTLLRPMGKTPWSSAVEFCGLGHETCNIDGRRVARNLRHPIPLPFKQSFCLLEDLSIGFGFAYSRAKVGGICVDLPGFSAYVLRLV